MDRKSTLDEGKEVVEFAVGGIARELRHQDEVVWLAGEFGFVPVEDNDVVEVAVEVGQILQVRRQLP